MKNSTEHIERTETTEPTPGADYQPQELLRITTLEQLKAISDPLRIDVIELLTHEALTVKQIASKLNQPPTKLYYHVSELEDAGFVTLVGTRVKSGIIEKYYRAVSESIQVDRSLLNSGSTEESLGLIISTVFDTTIADITRSHRAGRLFPTGEEADADQKRMMIMHDLCRLHRKDIPVFIDRFQSLLKEMAIQAEGEDVVTYGCTIAFYPHTIAEQDLTEQG